jgi:hypothetical protein
LELPLDPGKHTITVRAAGALEVTQSVAVAEGEHASLQLELAPLPEVASASSPLPAAPATTTVTLSPAARRNESSGPWPYVAWTAAGIGGVGLLTSGIAGLVAYTKMQEAKALCEGYPKNECPPASTQREEQARHPANISTAALAIGTAGLAFAGGYWLISRRGQTRMTGSVAPGLALITLQSRW